MASFPTQPAFVVHPTGWSENLLAHPMGRFLHAHEKLFDAADWDGARAFYTPDFEYVNGKGQAVSGAAAAGDALRGEYALFAAFFHEPVYGTAHAVELPAGEKGYRLFGCARMFVNLPAGNQEVVEKAHVDCHGRAWECVANGAFLFDAVEDEEGPTPEGLRMKRFQIFADPTAILGEAVRRGVVPVEALTGGGN
ncbi:hypothetical protein B0T24DRAFT_718283 [Lasiosphaeria ovina]|uniref:SnoaL-like domain-containing protein n=1 Tax=Lasiosphaeria ovina TaxID=92902 RepID=A0AAE0NA68_9PEZI|nr:hypothetical protein B0T24DRAFT_718283 [Lasiosphaeria ovina]